MQKNLKYRWLFNSTIDNLIELPSNTNDPDLHYSLQHEHRPQHIESLSPYKTKHNYNSNELQPRSNLYAYPKKYQQEQDNYLSQSFDVSSSNSHQSSNNNPGSYFYKVENFTSFGTISCSADNQFGSSGPCLYHIMVAGEFSQKRDNRKFLLQVEFLDTFHEKLLNDFANKTWHNYWRINLVATRDQPGWQLC